MSFYQHSHEHLFEELHRLDLLLNLQVARQRRDPAFTGFNEFRGLFISEEEIDQLTEERRDKASSVAQAEAKTQTLIDALHALETQIAVKSAAAQAQGVPLLLKRLAGAFQLSAFDLDALLVCFAPEVDIKYEKLYAYLQNDVTRKGPSVDLMLNLFCRSLDERLKGRQRLSPAAPLLAHQLLLYADEARGEQPPPPLLSRLLKLDERIGDYLLGVETLDRQLAPFTKLVHPQATLDQLLLPADTKEMLARSFQSQLNAQEVGPPASLFLYDGPEGSGKNFAAQALCRAAGLNLLTASAPQMVAEGTRSPALIRRLLREAVLSAAAVYLDHAEALLGEGEREAQARAALLDALKEFAGIVFIGSREPWSAEHVLGANAVFKVSFGVPGYELRKEFWQRLLAEEQASVTPDVDASALANKFSFTAAKIRLAFSEARSLALMRASGASVITADDLYQSCRAASSRKLMTLGRKIIPLYTWHDIVLPPDQLQLLREVCTHVKHRARIFGQWGFDRKVSLGKGLAVLFVGPSGTGKTMAAEIIAGELGLDLYKIDLSCVVSKYIGETEKNLNRIFQEADESNAILFFDEADAIFGKRSEVKDSHDRYANIEINYLLQKMEEYEGMVILASNFQKNIDEAFTRRLRFIVEFPFPDTEHRSLIWRNVFPQDTPMSAELDFDFLAHRLKLSGGNIRNIALNAAFLAAENSGHVQMSHIINATRRELQKMGRLFVEADFAQYVEYAVNEEAVAQ
jgi:SpoVK/Ycf46/Vps4 family AAA+-type ATPase